MIRINREFIAENTGTGKTFINQLPLAKEKMLRYLTDPLGMSDSLLAIPLNLSSRIYRKEEDFLSVIQFSAKIPYQIASLIPEDEIDLGMQTLVIGIKDDLSKGRKASA